MTAAFKGSLELLTWKEVRDSVMRVNKELAKVIDSLDPPDDHFFAKATYPYGSHVMRRATLMLPNKKGHIVPITDDSIDDKIKKSFSYNLNSNPVSVVLKNTFEIFLPLEDRTIPLYGLISPGSAFGAWRVLHPKLSHQPMFLWDMTAGARSLFMLPKITEAKKHLKLKKRFSLTTDKPRSLLDHWDIFREIAAHPEFESPWEAEILYFSKEWFEHLDDERWFAFYHHFHQSIWLNTEFLRNQPIWNLIFSMILKEYQARPSPYVADTAKYLIHVAVGALPGFTPAQDDAAGPIAGLQKVYQETYELKSYPPVIMHPATFNMDDASSHPVYYSLQFPTAIEFGPSSRARTSLVTDLHEIRSLLVRYATEFSSDKFNINDTPLHGLFNRVGYDYFHNNVELHSGMRNSAEMPAEDPGLLCTVDGKQYTGFPDMCSFVKGCIRISHK